MPVAIADAKPTGVAAVVAQLTVITSADSGVNATAHQISVEAPAPLFQRRLRLCQTRPAVSVMLVTSGEWVRKCPPSWTVTTINSLGKLVLIDTSHVVTLGLPPPFVKPLADVSMPSGGAS